MAQAVYFNLTEELVVKPSFARETSIFEADVCDRVSFYFKLLEAEAAQDLLRLCDGSIPVFKSVLYANLICVGATL